MSMPQETVTALRELESMLLAAPWGTLDPVDVAEKVREVRHLLAQQDARWIGTTKARRLLGVDSENTVKVWARLGLLQSWTLPNGRMQVLLDDVLLRRAEREALMAIGGDELSPEELRILKEGRPGTNPWEREKAEQPQ